MPNQPVPTGEPGTDSWNYQVTEELNALRTRVDSVRARIAALDNTATLTQVIEILEDL